MLLKYKSETQCNEFATYFFPILILKKIWKIYDYTHTYTGMEKSRFTVVHKNNSIINK